MWGHRAPVKVFPGAREFQYQTENYFSESGSEITSATAPEASRRVPTAEYSRRTYPSPMGRESNGERPELVTCPASFPAGSPALSSFVPVAGACVLRKSEPLILSL